MPTKEKIKTTIKKDKLILEIPLSELIIPKGRVIATGRRDLPGSSKGGG